MGSYLRCPRCDTGHDKPTADEDLNGGAECRCGYRYPQQMTIERWIADLDERLREIEGRN